MDSGLVKPRADAEAPSQPIMARPGSETEVERVARQADEIVEGERYATYHLDHKGKPFLAHYLDIGQAWNEPDLSYKQELNNIDSFIRAEITNKTLNNTTKAVYARLKQLEKQAGTSLNAPPEIRAKSLSAYIAYLSKIKELNVV